MSGVALLNMEITKIKAIIIMILTALFGAGVGEITDDKIYIPLLEKSQHVSLGADEEMTLQPLRLPASTCPVKVIAYVTNCNTGKRDKYYGPCMGEGCVFQSTEEILSERG